MQELVYCFNLSMMVIGTKIKGINDSMVGIQVQAVYLNWSDPAGVPTLPVHFTVTSPSYHSQVSALAFLLQILMPLVAFSPTTTSTVPV